MKTIKDYLHLIEGENQDACKALYEAYEPIMMSALGSKVNHHTWIGGYDDHICDTFELAIALFPTFERRYQIDFSLSDAILTLFLHDLEKPWKYSRDIKYEKELASFSDYHEFIFHMAEKFGISLQAHHKNAIYYVHGEGDDYSPSERIQKPLAAFIHICDVASARIGFDYPKRAAS